MDKLTAMNTFIRVAELGSLSAAARDLGLTQPAVSQQITALEKLLNILLFYRTTRAITLTEAGKSYYQQVKPILLAVNEAEETLHGLTQRLTGSLRIHGPTGIGQRYLARLAIAFQQLHPGLSIELLLDDRLGDVVSEGIDVAIRLGDLPAPGTVARRLGTVERILVAAPDYLAAQGAPRTAAELSGHAYIRYSGPSGDSPLVLHGPDGPEVVDVHPVFQANNTFALLLAIEGGLGIGGAQLPLIGRQLADRALVRVLPAYRYPALKLHAVYPAARFIPGKVRAWVDYLAQALDQEDFMAATRSGPAP
ncbi:LysR substrate-binding domain-containing protein [Sodalis sp. RH21]|uniref:LysR family transcriptional regulator n=1 Tax=unclassified Sodalis (in: enterobacteria) TaxID=2636512 RepID=UPI0039B44C84